MLILMKVMIAFNCYVDSFRIKFQAATIGPTVEVEQLKLERVEVEQKVKALLGKEEWYEIDNEVAGVDMRNGHGVITSKERLPESP